MNINVVGTSGSGKSTLARRPAHRLGLPWIELDRLYWRPNWQGAPDEAFFAAIAAATATPGWVLDGNYNRSRSVKWRAVDLVIWVDYGFWRTLRQCGMAGGEPGVATSGAVAGHGQLREFSPFVLQPGIHHPLDAENPAAASPTLSGRYAGSAISPYSLRPGAQSAAGRGAAPRAGSAAFSRAYLIFSSTHVN